MGEQRRDDGRRAPGVNGWNPPLFPPLKKEGHFALMILPLSQRGTEGDSLSAATNPPLLPPLKKEGYTATCPFLKGGPRGIHPFNPQVLQP